MLIIKEDKILMDSLDTEETNNEVVEEKETVEVKSTTNPLSDREFTWESMASVEIMRQNELIAEVYSLMSSDDTHRIEFIKNEWESLSAEGIDSNLEKRFQDALEKYENRSQNVSKAQEIKKELIQKAEAAKNSDAWAKTAQLMHQLQDEWKEAGFAGVGIDQDLWERFSAAKNHFFNRRKENYEEMKEAHEKAAVLKETLIEKAEAIKDSKEWKETREQMHALMDEWKAAGFAGRDVDQQLWDRFNAARQTFYQNQKEYYDGLREMYAQAKEAKEVIIVKAKELATEPVNEETRLKFVGLFENWKAIGSAGRKFEEKLWKEFKAIQDDFYARLKANREREQIDNVVLTQEDIQRLEVRIQALEQVNEMIDVKLENLRNNVETESILEEIQELENNKKDNLDKLQDYYQQLGQLQKNL